MQMERISLRFACRYFLMRRLPLLVVMAATILTTPFSVCLAGNVEVVDAMVPPIDGTGGDVPLLMHLINHEAEPDALVRVRCPFANFSEKHTVDYGEGAPSMRTIPTITLPAHGDVVLSTKSFHVMLLQVREKLVEGQVLPCTLAFRNAGTVKIMVRVSEAAINS